MKHLPWIKILEMEVLVVVLTLWIYVYPLGMIPFTTLALPTFIGGTIVVGVMAIAIPYLLGGR